MLEKRYIKRMYIEVPICDKCGAELKPTGECLTSFPAQYPYHCSNPDCDGHTTFREDELPNTLKYEYD